MRKMKMLVGSVIVLAAIAAVGGPASNPTPLPSNVWVSGSIAAGGEEWFEFRYPSLYTPLVPPIVSIETTLGSLPDSYITLYAGTRLPGQPPVVQRVESDDDSGLGLASKIERPIIVGGSAPNGHYFCVQVKGYSASQAGTFSIRLRYPSAESIVPDGRKYSKTIGTQNEWLWFVMQCSNELPYVLETSLGTCPDTYMYLYREDLDVASHAMGLMVSDDDSGEGFASRILATMRPYRSGFACPHMIKIRAFSEYQTGTFNFWIMPDSRPVLSPGTTFYWREIKNNAPDQFCVNLKQSGLYYFEAVRGTIGDCRVSFSGPDSPQYPSTPFKGSFTVATNGYVGIDIPKGMYYLTVTGIGDQPNGSYAIRVRPKQ